MTVVVNRLRIALAVLTLIVSSTFFLTVIPMAIVESVSPDLHTHLVKKAIFPIAIMALSDCVAVYGTAIDVAANPALSKNRKLTWLALVFLLNLGAAPLYWFFVAFREPAKDPQ